MFKAGEQTPEEDYKKKRQNYSENIRRSNREQIFSKRRNIESKNMESAEIQSQSHELRLLIVDPNYSVEIQNFLKSSYSIDNFTELVQAFFSEDIVKKHYGLIGIRKILSIAKNPPIQAVIDAGLVPRMIEFVKQTQFPQMQLEATWALTNVAAGTNTQCQSIIDKGGIPIFVNLLKSDNLGIVEQAIWAIGNISSDCIFYRDNIIKHGGLINLVRVIEKEIDQQNIVKHGCWALSNLCRGKPLPKFDNVKSAIPLLAQVVASERIKDKEIVADCCWAISYHSDVVKDIIPILISSGITPKIVNFLSDSYISLVVPSVRIAGNISTGTSVQTDQLLKYDVLTYLEALMGNYKKVVRRQACWVVSNICAGTQGQVKKVLERKKLINQILNLLETDTPDVKREICYIFSNMSHSGHPQEIFNFYKQKNILGYYVGLFSCEDDKTVETALDCLYIILGVGEKFKNEKGRNPLVLDLFQLQAIDHLQTLQQHNSIHVYENVTKILEQYFELQDPLEL